MEQCKALEYWEIPFQKPFVKPQLLLFTIKMQKKKNSTKHTQVWKSIDIQFFYLEYSHPPGNDTPSPSDTLLLY